MRWLAAGLGVSLALNFLVLWRLAATPSQAPEPAEVTSAAQSATLSSSPALPVKSGAVLPPEAEQRLVEQLADLSARLEAIEESLADEAELAAEAELAKAQVAESRLAQSAASARASLTPETGEEWFWNAEGSDEASVEFGATDGFSVNAVQCRGDWCRVEAP